MKETKRKFRKIFIRNVVTVTITTAAAVTITTWLSQLTNNARAVRTQLSANSA
jgi:flagellar basal body-associated protein FliL